MHNSYWRYEEEQTGDVSALLEEMDYVVSTLLDMSYYKKHPENYTRDREDILKLSEYLIHSKEELKQSISCNERSFEIFHREKYLSQQGGRTLLKNLGFQMADLSYYETTEPLSYYSKHKNFPQKILIIENKDTFYSMRKYMEEAELYQIYVEDEQVCNLVKSQGETLDCDIERYSNMIYMNPKLENYNLGYSKMEAQDWL